MISKLKKSLLLILATLPIKKLAVFSFLAGLITLGHAQYDSKNFSPDELSITIIKIDESIHIDGHLAEMVWQKATAIDRFIQREPEERAPVSERTEVRIFYNEDNLYIGFKCWDSEADRIIANEMRRDMVLLNNDCVEIYLDTYHDHRTAFLFSTNPLGAQRDGIITAEVSDEEQNWDWNGVWDNASQIDSSCWTAEIAIPFKTLRFHGGEEIIWGINFARYIPRKREEAFWTPILRDYGWFGKYRVSAYGHLTGFHELGHPQKLEFKPFVLSGVQREFEQGLPYKREFNLGLDAKYHLTPNLTADITWNTDFAQVEADQEQVNLTRFELFFPEKRDFFLEGAGIFRFGERSFSPVFPASVLFFSRRIGLSEDNEIVPLFGGVKITGKASRYNIGMLNMVADRTNYINDDDEQVTIPRTNFSVLRIKKDILSNSSIGFIGLSKESIDDKSYNRNVGIDGNIFLTKNAQFSGFLAKTFSPGIEKHDGAAYVDFLYMDDFWTVFLAQNTIQDDFNAEMGFVPRTGIRKTQFNFGISPRPKVLNIRQVSLFNDFNYYTNQHGRLETRTNFFGIFSLFQNGANLIAIFSQNYERLTEDFEIHDGVIIQPAIYRYNNAFLWYESDRSKAISAKMIMNFGNFYDGNIYSTEFEANFKLDSRLSMNFLFNHNDVKLNAGKFKTNIIGTRILYTFSPQLFAKAFIQWNDDSETILGNFLVHFIHTPGSDLFFVFNEELDTSGNKLSTNNRVLLMKFNYLLNF
ncbi:MAG: carbohydrate binding family 9 domain-containing protein [bacterium]|nr:MAG: carbohydrate binding family 9 domain-containing protein [bacterium]